jgi:CzcA family heavy metal efflux pump
VRDRLPKNLVPMMTPITSLMGEIQFVGLLSSQEEVSSIELRTLADWVVRSRLMALEGVSQVVVIGGEVKQYHILVSSEKLQHRGISLHELKDALSEISLNTTGGFLDIGEKEFLIRPLGRVDTVEDIENSFVGLHLGTPVLVKDVATVKLGHRVKRGDGSVNGQPAVVLTIKKQPGANTVALTQKIEEELEDLQEALPPGVQIKHDLFKQAHFIKNAIANVEEALRDGAIMVALVLIFFLMNWRTTGITMLAIPLSLVMTAIIFKIMGLGINVMTLGGLAIAIGELVDDAIVDVENVFRRLRENRWLDSPQNSLKVVFEASKEIRNSIVFSTIIVILVFIPLFSLSGIEGRLFAPLGVAYIISLLASLLVSLTITPVLCYYLLPQLKLMAQRQEGPIVRFIKAKATTILHWTIPHPKSVLLTCVLLLLGALALLPFMGQDFLPKFNEGTATVNVMAPPDASLTASNQLGTQVEQVLLTIPEVKSTTRRTGRAEMDEHAEGVHYNEIDVDFHEEGRPREAVLKAIRHKIKTVGDMPVNIGQPISHRIDHLLSGVRAQIAIKIFGPDLSELRRLAGEVRLAIGDVEGLVDLQAEPLVLNPQLKVSINRERAAQYRLRSGTLAEDLEMVLNGEVLGQVLEDQKIFDLFLRLDETSRANPEKIQQTVLTTLPSGESVRLADVAQVYESQGPNMINHEDLLRRMIIFANSGGRDLAGLMTDIQNRIAEDVELPTGYFIKYGGQFERQQQATRLLFFLGGLSFLGIFLVLFFHFRSTILSLQIMVNIPLALIGSVMALFVTERVLSVATLVAFITLCGIASRNGIMMISHYIHLIKEEGESFDLKMIIRGTQERLIPVCMTAFTAILALMPLVFAHGEPGKEILHPVAIVIVGGLLSSTLLDIFVTPTLFYRFGKKPVERLIKLEKRSEEKL